VNRARIRSLTGHAAYAVLGISLGAAATWCSVRYWPGPGVPLWVSGLAAGLLAVVFLTVLAGAQARVAGRRRGRRAHARPRPRAARKAP
jgi:hypothetical protein